jgi:hypothetical protein
VPAGQERPHLAAEVGPVEDLLLVGLGGEGCAGHLKLLDLDAFLNSMLRFTLTE